jgi:hypothetical protein
MLWQTIKMDRNNLFGTRGTVVLFPPGQGDLYFPGSRKCLWGPPFFYSMGTGTRRPEYEAEQLFLSSARKKNKWSQTTIPPYFLHKENFTVV